MYNSISTYDWQTILGLLETVTWAAVVGLGIWFLIHANRKLFSKQKQQAVWLVFAAWAVASIGLTSIATYSYFADTRESLSQTLTEHQ